MTELAGIGETVVKNPKILLYGGGCVGKSHVLATLFKLRDIRPNQRVIILATENNALAGLEKGLAHYKVELQPNQLIIALVKPKSKKAFGAKLSAFKAFAENSVSANYSTDKNSNANKDKYTYLVDVITKLTKLEGIDYVTKETVNLGNVGELEKEDVLCIDGLTPIVHGIWNLVQGDKLVNDMNDYQVVQKQVTDITSELVNSVDCGLIMLAHEEADAKGVLHPSINCGQALHGRYIGHYTDTIYAFKQGSKFLWSGKRVKVETGARSFPAEDNLVPSFDKYDFFR